MKFMFQKVKHKDKFTLHSLKNVTFKFSHIKQHNDHVSNQKSVKGKGSVLVTI
jgi:hypothetical protein